MAGSDEDVEIGDMYFVDGPQHEFIADVKQALGVLERVCGVRPNAIHVTDEVYRERIMFVEKQLNELGIWVYVTPEVE